MTEAEMIQSIGEDLARWAGRLNDDQRIRFAEALQHSSIPDACETIADSIREMDGTETCRTCGESYPDAGDGWDGECPTCADITEQREHPEDQP